MLVRIIEHSRGYYERREVPRGSEYVWHPERFVLAYGCGEEAVLLGLLGDAQCPCGADLAPFVRGKRRAGTGEKRETNRPWRPSYRVRSRTSRNFEYDTWQELKTLE